MWRQPPRTLVWSGHSCPLLLTLTLILLVTPSQSPPRSSHKRGRARVPLVPQAIPSYGSLLPGDRQAIPSRLTRKRPHLPQPTLVCDIQPSPSVGKLCQAVIFNSFPHQPHAAIHPQAIRDVPDIMVIVVISNKKQIPPSPKPDFTSTANSIFLNILPVTHWFQRFYPIGLRRPSRNPNKAKNLAKRYQNIFLRSEPCH
jgi:hypothetical protein